MKAQVFPLMTSALLLVIVNFMMGAAAHTRAVPPWVHAALAWGTLAVCVAALWREYLVRGREQPPHRGGGVTARGHPRRRLPVRTVTGRSVTGCKLLHASGRAGGIGWHGGCSIRAGGTAMRARRWGWMAAATIAGGALFGGLQQRTERA